MKPDRAEVLATEALARWQSLFEPDWPRTGDALYVLGYIAALRDNQQEAERWFTATLEWARAIGADLFTAMALEALGNVRPGAGRPASSGAVVRRELGSRP